MNKLLRESLTPVDIRNSDDVRTLLAVRPTTEPATRSCVCGHADLAHDPIARRFCAATASASLSRGCVCPPASESKPR